MKKILCPLLLLIATISFSQEKDDKKSENELNVLSLEFSAGVGLNVGFVHESKDDDDDDDKKNKSNILKVYSSGVRLSSSDSAVQDVDGMGYGIEIGSRYYLGKKEYQGLHLSSYLIYGRYSFEESNISNVADFTIPFDGKYEYLSFFSPEIGYKFLIGEHFAVNLHAGTAWLIEINSRGDVDNHAFDNWVGRFGLALGYNF
jgi:hypothetical protein